MADKPYLKGQPLFALARKKARILGVEYQRLKLAELIRAIQHREGNDLCFRDRGSCSETICCWQASCGAVMETGE